MKVFKKHFEFSGNFDTHYGIMPNCDIKIPFLSLANSDECCRQDEENEKDQNYYDDERDNYYYPNYYYAGYWPWNHYNYNYYFYNK